MRWSVNWRIKNVCLSCGCLCSTVTARIFPCHAVARGQTKKQCLLVMRLTVEPAEMTIVESFRLVVESPINLTQINFSGDEQPWMNLEI